MRNKCIRKTFINKVILIIPNTRDITDKIRLFVCFWFKYNDSNKRTMNTEFLLSTEWTAKLTNFKLYIDVINIPRNAHNNHLIDINVFKLGWCWSNFLKHFKIYKKPITTMDWHRPIKYGKENSYSFKTFLKNKE